MGEAGEEDKDRSLHVLVERVHRDHTQQLLQVRGHRYGANIVTLQCLQVTGMGQT